jgi:hypothetical protein
VSSSAGVPESRASITLASDNVDFETSATANVSFDGPNPSAAWES